MKKIASSAQSRSVPAQTARFLAAAASLIAIGAVGFFTATPAANATEYVWGNADGNWADGTSWVGGSAPDGTVGDTYRLFRDGATGSAGNVVTIADGTTIYLTSVANSTPNQGNDNYDTSLAAYRGGLVIRGNNDIWTIQGGTLDTGTFVAGAYAIHIAPAKDSGNGGVNIASAITGSGSIFVKEEGSNGSGPAFSGDLSGYTGTIYGARYRNIFFKGN
ncbi:MAG: hypothetical protein LBV28_05460, partial [Puniceicoccales bacterium]|nr:hypothetical protein [Puniceicoccales bacterium]